MELNKEIYLNTDKLIKNSKIKISYSGNLITNSPDRIYCHFGYGNNWDNIQDLELYKTDVGYQNEIEITGSDQFNFCFYDNFNNWDNNNGNNYSFPIDDKEKQIQEINELLQESIDQNLALVTLETSYFGKVKCAFNKLLKSIPNLFKRMAKAK